MNRDVCEHGNPEPCDKCNSVALRLADLIDRDLKNAAHHAEAAAELRRLHAVNQKLLEALKRAEPFIEGRMLDCEAIYDDSDDGGHYEAYATARDTLEQARATIAKAEVQA